MRMREPSNYTSNNMTVDSCWLVVGERWRIELILTTFCRRTTSHPSSSPCPRFPACSNVFVLTTRDILLMISGEFALLSKINGYHEILLKTWNCKPTSPGWNTNSAYSRVNSQTFQFLSPTCTLYLVMRLQNVWNVWMGFKQYTLVKMSKIWSQSRLAWPYIWNAFSSTKSTQSQPFLNDWKFIWRGRVISNAGNTERYNQIMRYFAFLLNFVISVEFCCSISCTDVMNEVTYTGLSTLRKRLQL